STMRKHNIFTLGIILSCIYGINAMADWPTITATDIWTNPERTTLANQRCSDCCKTDCWLPSGTYYDNKGTFTETCTGEPLSCPSGQYDIGFSSCISASTKVSGHGYWDFGGATSNTTTYGLTAGGQWGVTFSYGKVTGIASCNSTKGTHGVATTTNFSNTSNGKDCWCKMTSPAASRWVFNIVTTTEYDCYYACAWDCGHAVLYGSGFWSGVFGSVE
ncbi:MAG: hypothetical protein KBS86_01415, partial [Proteobacteria bacterium]|nr:hypothetical protein [Candidatus Enterousia scatequi]